MKQFLISAVLGFLALGLVNFTAQWTGVALAASGLLGIPGVTLLVLLNLLL